MPQELEEQKIHSQQPDFLKNLAPEEWRSILNTIDNTSELAGELYASTSN